MLRQAAGQQPSLLALVQAAVQDPPALDSLLLGGLLEANPGATAEDLLHALDASSSSICGKNFDEGDLVYQCATCGVDPTCVVCSDCFDRSAGAHEGHEVTCYRSGGNGGTCDCGDHEAWSRECCLWALQR